MSVHGFDYDKGLFPVLMIMINLFISFDDKDKGFPGFDDNDKSDYNCRMALRNPLFYTGFSLDNAAMAIIVYII